MLPSMRMRSFINLNEKEAEINAIKSNKELKLRVGARAVDYVARLHKNMGHPSAATLR